MVAGEAHYFPVVWADVQAVGWSAETGGSILHRQMRNLLPYLAPEKEENLIIHFGRLY